MAPPAFSDLGKEAKDVLNKNYHLGVVKLDVKTKTPLGIEFNLNGVSNNDTGKVTAFLESKHGWNNYGVTLKEKWNADNTLSTDVSLKDAGLKGLELGATGYFAPQTGRKNGTLKGAFKNDMLHLKSDLNVDHSNSVLKSSLVLQHQNLLCGLECGFEPNKDNKITGKQMSLVYKTPELVLHTNYSNDNEISGSIYQKLKPNLETGITLGWNNGSNTSKVNVGCVYKLDCCSSVRAKVNNNSQIGLGFTHRLRDGINLTLSALLDGKNLNQGGHKLGLGIEFQDI